MNVNISVISKRKISKTKNRTFKKQTTTILKS